MCPFSRHTFQFLSTVSPNRIAYWDRWTHYVWCLVIDRICSLCFFFVILSIDARWWHSTRHKRRSVFLNRHNYGWDFCIWKSFFFRITNIIGLAIGLFAHGIKFGQFFFCHFNSRVSIENRTARVWCGIFSFLLIYWFHIKWNETQPNWPCQRKKKKWNYMSLILCDGRVRENRIEETANMSREQDENNVFAIITNRSADK